MKFSFYRNYNVTYFGLSYYTITPFVKSLDFLDFTFNCHLETVAHRDIYDSELHYDKVFTHKLFLGLLSVDISQNLFFRYSRNLKLMYLLIDIYRE
jgi:hypothetical protein